MGRLFGTDGIRGRAFEPPLTLDEVRDLGRAAGDWFLESPGAGPIVIGRDPRASGPDLERALAEGLNAAGVHAVLAGVIPTPAVSTLVGALSARGGAVISASHNPYHDNGIKFFGPGGAKLSTAEEDRIEELLLRPRFGEGSKEGRARSITVLEKARDLYAEKALAFYGNGPDLSGMTIHVDCANGAASSTTPTALRLLGARVETHFTDPDGSNINRDCGSLHPEHLQEAIRLAGGGAVGFAHDGDADRVLMVDEDGALVDGDKILGVLARHLAEQGATPEWVVGTVMTNSGLETVLDAQGTRLERTPVGDRNVKEAMDRLSSPLGGEPSGHVIFREAGPTGDGLLTALAVLRVMARTGRPLRELHSHIQLYPQVTRSLRVPNKPPLDEVETLQHALTEAEDRLRGRGRILIRYSGTESVLRIMVEAPERDAVEGLAERLVDAADHALNHP